MDDINHGILFICCVIFSNHNSPKERTVKSIASASEMKSMESGDSAPASAVANVTDVDPARTHTVSATHPTALPEEVSRCHGRMVVIVFVYIS